MCPFLDQWQSSGNAMWWMAWNQYSLELVEGPATPGEHYWVEEGGDQNKMKLLLRWEKGKTEVRLATKAACFRCRFWPHPNITSLPQAYKTSSLLGPDWISDQPSISTMNHTTWNSSTRQMKAHILWLLCLTFQQQHLLKPETWDPCLSSGPSHGPCINFLLLP